VPLEEPVPATSDATVEARMTDAERLARHWLAAAELTGKMLCVERGWPVDMDDTTKFEELTDLESEGMVRTMQHMLEQGYITMGPNA